jgi:hypothetical protein
MNVTPAIDDCQGSFQSLGLRQCSIGDAKRDGDNGYGGKRTRQPGAAPWEQGIQAQP